MMQMFKRALSALVAAAMLAAGFALPVFAEASEADYAAAYAVDRQIAALAQTQQVFNNCDSIEGDVVANFNSGADIKELAPGQGVGGGTAVKFSKRAAGEVEFNEGFRAPQGVPLAGFAAVEFDLYLSAGLTDSSNAGAFVQVCLQDQYAPNGDVGKFGFVSILDSVRSLAGGRWYHITAPIAGQNTGAAAQITLRFWNNWQGEAGEYILVDNVVLTNPKEVTPADKEAIEAAGRAYDSLTETQQPLVTGAATLAGYRQMLAEYAAAPGKVEALIRALTVTSAVFHDCETTANAANLNSSADKMSLAEGQGAGGGNALQFTKTLSGSGVVEFNEAFRTGGDGVNTADFTSLEFDLYLSDGLTYAAEGNMVRAYLQSEQANNNDNAKIDTVDFAEQVAALSTGGWHHITLPLTGKATGVVKQISLRLRNCFAGEAGTYIQVDNLVFTAPRTLTKEDANEVNAAKAAFDALDETQQAQVSNSADLTAALEEMKKLLNPDPLTAEQMDALIQSLGEETVAYNECDENATVANLNSGADSKEMVPDGYDGGTAAKFIKKADGYTEFNEAFRHNGFALTGMSTFSFRLFVSAGITVQPGERSDSSKVYFHEATNDHNDNAIKELPFKEAALTAKPGEWVTVTLDVAGIETSALRQIDLRFYDLYTGAAGEYILIDNLTFTRPHEVGYADKEAVEAAEAEYRRMTPEEQGKVTLYETLQGYLATIAEAEKAVSAVEEAIAALPESPAAEQEEAVAAAYRQYAALEDSLRQAVQNADKLTAAMNAVVAAKGETEKLQAAKDAIDALPAPGELTLANKEQVEQAEAAFGELGVVAQQLLAEQGEKLQLAAERLQALAKAEAVQQVVQAVNALSYTGVVYADADCLRTDDLDVLANINSGSVAMSLETANKTQGTASAKLTKTADDNATPDFPLGLRTNEEFFVRDFAYVEFDLYLSSGFTPVASWANLALQDAHANTPDEHKFASISFIDQLAAVTPGQWCHLRVEIPASVRAQYGDSLIRQITLRPGNGSLVGNRGEYLLVDDVCLTSGVAITPAAALQKKAALQAIEESMTALPSDDDRAAVLAATKLADWRTALQTAEAALAAVEEKLNALPPLVSLTVANEEDVAAARAAYNGLDEALRPAAEELLQKLTAYEERMAALKEAAEAEALAAAARAVDDQIAALGDDPTEEAVAAARQAYEDLTDPAKALVQKLAELEAAEQKLADKAAAKVVADEIEKLPAADKVTTADKAAIEAAQANFDKLTEAQQALVENKAKLDEALAALEAALTPAVKLGDVNDDGKVDAVDALEVLRYAVHKRDFTEQQKQAANVNNDAGINAADALEILKKAVGKPACF